MIYFKLMIHNPFNLWKTEKKDYYCNDWQISKNKSFEIQFTKWEEVHSIFDFVLDLRWNKQDHAGPSLKIEIFNFFFSMNIYDHRHWDYDHDTWE